MTPSGDEEEAWTAVEGWEWWERRATERRRVVVEAARIGRVADPIVVVCCLLKQD